MRGNHLVREARKRAGLTQSELAERVGTTQSAIARLERGVGRPTLARISELVAACGLEVQVRLVPADEHDWAMVDRNRSLGTEERVARALVAIRLAEAMQEAGQVQRSTAEAS